MVSAGNRSLSPTGLEGYHEETAYTVNWVTGGLFDGVLCQVVSIGNAFDDDHNERAKVKHACGYARAQVISPLNEG